MLIFVNRKITGVVTTHFAKLKRKTFRGALYLGPIQRNLKLNLIFKLKSNFISKTLVKFSVLISSLLTHFTRAKPVLILISM